MGASLLRHIQDEEMNFLFDQSDLVLLPYREIYQSAVLQTAVHHRRFVIASEIPYFSEFFQEYPSFGICYGCSPESLAAELKRRLSGEYSSKRPSLDDDDIRRFEAVDVYDRFAQDLKNHFGSQ